MIRVPYCGPLFLRVCLGFYWSVLLTTAHAECSHSLMFLAQPALLPTEDNVLATVAFTHS